MPFLLFSKFVRPPPPRQGPLRPGPPQRYQHRCPGQHHSRPQNSVTKQVEAWLPPNTLSLFLFLGCCAFQQVQVEVIKN